MDRSPQQTHNRTRVVVRVISVWWSFICQCESLLSVAVLLMMSYEMTWFLPRWSAFSLVSGHMWLSTCCAVSSVICQVWFYVFPQSPGNVVVGCRFISPLFSLFLVNQPITQLAAHNKCLYYCRCSQHCLSVGQLITDLQCTLCSWLCVAADPSTWLCICLFCFASRCSTCPWQIERIQAQW